MSMSVHEVRMLLRDFEVLQLGGRAKTAQLGICTCISTTLPNLIWNGDWSLVGLLNLLVCK